MLFLLATALSAATAENRASHYKAVTETEYAIELTLNDNGRALFEFDTWEADDSAPPTHGKLPGTWVQKGTLLRVHLTSGPVVAYQLVQCLSYQEFGQNGCSPSLKLVSSNLPTSYGLQRFGLWDARLLRVEP